MKKISIILSITIFSIAFAESSYELDWLPFGKARELSKKTDKPLVVYIERNGCGWCRKFWNNTLTDDEIEKQLDSFFVVTKINLSSMNKVEVDGETYTERQLGSMFAVRGVPATIFVTPQDTVLAKLPGYMPPEQFKVVIKYFGEGWYENMSYQEFMESEKKLKQKD
ncbi:hypothetical protein DRQ33_01990 [bacterium]|nr:MAG: hypothetical protein DRQ33_01990 [bacterium]